MVRVCVYSGGVCGVCVCVYSGEGGVIKITCL